MKRQESPCKFIKTTTRMDSQTPNSDNTSSTEQEESKESYYDSLRKEVEESYQRLKKLVEENPNPMELK